MGTVIRPELSNKNKYWIEKHRYYELKHFCLQYSTWKKAYNSLIGLEKSEIDLNAFIKSSNISDPTHKLVEARLYYKNRIDMVEQAAIEASEDLHNYILIGVTNGKSYDYLKLICAIPCCKDVYYLLYRRFFWILDKRRK